MALHALKDAKQEKYICDEYISLHRDISAAFTFPPLKQSVLEKPGILKTMLLLSSSEAVSELQRFAVPTGVFLLLLHSQRCRLVRLEQSRTTFFLRLGMGCTWDSYCLTCYCLETITARRKKKSC